LLSDPGQRVPLPRGHDNALLPRVEHVLRHHRLLPVRDLLYVGNVLYVGDVLHLGNLLHGHTLPVGQPDD